MTFTKSMSLVLVDPSVQDYQALVKNLRADAEVVVLDADRDGVEQVSQVLGDRRAISSLHILSHGDPGTVYLGNTALSSGTLPHYSAQIQSWAAAMAADANILLYGCEVAADAIGEQFVEDLSALTQTDIAASRNRTGNAALGGDWNLDFTTAAIDADLAFQPEAMAAYESVLATVFLDESFRNNDVDDNTAWIFGKGSGSNDPFLTARTTPAPSAPGGLPGGGTDAAGQGALRLTNNQTNQASFVIYNKPIPSPNGLSISFELYSYGGTGADGVSFFLFDAAQSNVTAGAFGGSLGYAQRDNPAITGIEGGYLGIGFDEFGNYSNGNEGRVNDPGAGGFRPDAIAIRGSEANRYKYLTGTGSLPGGIDSPSATSRDAAGVKRTARIDINPNGTTSNVSVKIDLNGDGDFLDASEAPESLQNYVVPSVNGNLPANFKFGFASSSGDNTNFHEIRNLKITEANPGVVFTGEGVDTGAVPSVTTVEGGTPVTVSAALTTRPNSNVTLNLTSNDTTEGTVSVRSLTFTPQNWDQPQSFVINPVDDSDRDGNISYTIGTTLTTTDGVYRNINPPDINVTNNDNEAAAPVNPNVTLSLTGSPLAEGGGVATVTATLSEVTTVPVTVNLGFTGTATNGTDYTPSGSSITINPGTSAGLVTLTGLPDALPEGDESIAVTATAVTNGNLATPQAVTATITDGTVAPNSPPSFPNTVAPVVAPSSITGLTGLEAVDADGIGFYTITTVPATEQGGLFLGNPQQGGVPVTAGQQLSTTQIGQLFFSANPGFTGTSYSYTATDTLGATSAPQLVRFTAANPPTPNPQTGACVDGTPINGTNSTNTLTGADGVNDFIFGRGGNDRIDGRGCNDLLSGGNGNDTLFGRSGQDRLLGRAGTDNLSGGAGNDVLNGGLGRDTLKGGGANDRLRGRRGADLLIGGAGDDTLNGGVKGDRLRGGSGDDNLNGGRGNDFVKGGSGNDILRGRVGLDTLVGFAGDDQLIGGLNADILVGSEGADTLTGNRGRDVFEYRSLLDGGDTVTDFEGNRDTINLSRISGGRSFNEFVSLAQSGGNTLVQVNGSSGLVTLATLSGVAASSLGASNFVL